MLSRGSLSIGASTVRYQCGNAMTETKPKRRWFRFHLRTFLVIVTLLGGWIGWNLYEVRQREQCFNYLKDGGAQIQAYGDTENRSPLRMAKFPRILGLFGAQPVRSIKLTEDHYGLSDAKLTAERFPEAEVTFRNRDGTYIDVQ